MRAHVGFLVIFSLLVIHTEFTSAAEKEVLVRDRLLFLLCDQFDEYMKTGEFPEEVKTMPEKYKKIRPGASTKINGRKMKGKGRNLKAKGRKLASKGRKAWNSRPKRSYQITILDLQDDTW